MNLKLTHTEGDVEFVRAEDVEIGADSSRGQIAYSVALKLPEGWVDYIRAVRSVERMPDAPFHYFHTPNAGVWTDDLVAAKAPTPMGDRIRQSLGERMSQHYSEQLPDANGNVCNGNYVTCPKDNGECAECGKRECPFGDPFHFHHDGCPTCDTERAEHDADLQALREEEQFDRDQVEPLRLRCEMLAQLAEELEQKLDIERERVAILRRLLINRINNTGR